MAYASALSDSEQANALLIQTLLLKVYYLHICQLHSAFDKSNMLSQYRLLVASHRNDYLDQNFSMSRSINIIITCHVQKTCKRSMAMFFS